MNRFLERAKYQVAVPAAVLMLLVGCGGGGGDGSTEQAASKQGELLSAAIREPAGANCPKGGIRIVWGWDANGDGVLGRDEIDHDDFDCFEKT